MAKAEAILTTNLSTVGLDKLAPHERSQTQARLLLVGCEGTDRAEVEHLSLYGGALKHSPLGGL
jgi:hypothetical protein